MFRRGHLGPWGQFCPVSEVSIIAEAEVTSRERSGIAAGQPDIWDESEIQ
jgi:hypothetical protein